MNTCNERISTTSVCFSSCFLTLIAAGAFFQASSIRAQQPVGANVDQQRIYYERLIRTIEPQLVGRLDRLEQYLQLFRREMINDTRLFAFHVKAEPKVSGPVILTGFVEFEETHRALLTFLKYLGFQKLDDRVEVLPSRQLGTKRFGLVKTTHSFSYDRPDGTQEVVTDCLLGEPLYLLKQCANGFFLCHGGEGYVGYVRAADVRRISGPAMWQYQQEAQIRIRHDVRVTSELTIPMGARLRCLGRREGTFLVELPTGNQVPIPVDAGEIHRGHSNQRMERVLVAARRLLGARYVWGGKTSDGIDCSGLVQVAFAAEGIDFPRDANQQVYLGRLVATRWFRNGLRSGDTLYFLGAHGKIAHTAIYLGQGKYLEAVRPVVRVTSFRPDDKQYDARRSAAFAFAKRLWE